MAWFAWAEQAGRRYPVKYTDRPHSKALMRDHGVLEASLRPIAAAHDTLGLNELAAIYGGGDQAP